MAKLSQPPHLDSTHNSNYVIDFITSFRFHNKESIATNSNRICSSSIDKNNVCFYSIRHKNKRDTQSVDQTYVQRSKLSL